MEEYGKNSGCFVVFFSNDLELSCVSKAPDVSLHIFPSILEVGGFAGQVVRRSLC